MHLYLFPSSHTEQGKTLFQLSANCPCGTNGRVFFSWTLDTFKNNVKTPFNKTVSQVLTCIFISSTIYLIVPNLFCVLTDFDFLLFVSVTNKVISKLPPTSWIFVKTCTNAGLGHKTVVVSTP